MINIIVFSILAIIIIFTIIEVIKKKKLNPAILSLIMILVGILIVFGCYGIFYITHLPSNNDVSSDYNHILENYIKENYNLELKVKESTIIHRGDIGINPGIEYIFTLEDKNKTKYTLSINEMSELDLPFILTKNPELNIIRAK